MENVKLAENIGKPQMTDDIVTRLRDETCYAPECCWLFTDAADEIERLRARVDHWKLSYETALKLYYNEHGRLPNE